MHKLGQTERKLP